MGEWAADELEQRRAQITALEQHISDLEKSLENARKERDEAVLVVERVRGGLADAGVPVAVSPQEWLRVSWLANERRKAETERDAALADNAALVDLLKDGRDSEEEDEAWADRVLEALDKPHPGAALLEKHREELAAAARRHETTRATMQVREEEHRKEVERLHRTIATLTGDAYKATLVRARNEGLEAARETMRKALPERGLISSGQVSRALSEIDALKEPEGGQS